MKFSKALAIFPFILFFISTNIYAAELHVGSGQTYSTISSAISASGSGDTIIIHAGSYNEYNLSPKSNTTLRKASDEDSPFIDGQQDTCSQNPIFKMNGVDNVIFDGLTVTGGGTHFRGNWFIGYDGTCNNITIKNCETYIDGACASADNPSIIVLYDCDNCAIRDTYVYGVNIVGGSKGVNGIKIWSGNASPTIENCEIYDLSGKGLDNKHGTSDQSITGRYNYIHDCKEGIHNNAGYSTFEHNLIVGCRYGIRSYYDAGGKGGSHTTYNHNTLYNCGNGAMMPDGSESGLCDVTFKDNLICNYGQSGMLGLNISPYGSAYSHNFTIHHNLYYSTSTNDIVREFGRNYDQLEWQTKDYDIGSINSKPTFVNLSGNMNQIADFSLAEGGPGKGVASDGKDMGVDVSLVGPRRGSSPPAGVPGDPPWFK